MPMDKEKFEAVVQSIKNDTCEIFLNLSNIQIDDAQALTLAAALGTNKTLQVLFLSSNQIGDAGTKALAAALGTIKTLQALFLNDNQIGDAGAKALAAALGTNKTLEYLELGHNKIGDVGIKAIAAALATNKSLLSLHLGNNKISDAGAKALVKMLETNTTLRFLQLHGNKISEALLKTINHAIERNRALADESKPLIAQASIPQSEQKEQHETKQNKEQHSIAAPPRGDAKGLQESARIQISPSQLEFINTLQSLGLKPEVLQQLQTLNQTPLSTLNPQEYTSWFKGFNDKLNQVEAQMKQFAQDPEAQQEQAYIDRPVNVKLKNYQHRLQKELSCFILCYFLAPAGIFKLEENKKQTIISALGSLPLAGNFLKILTVGLSYANKKKRLYHINHATELFGSLDQITTVCCSFARLATLAKEENIQQQKEVVYQGLAKVKDLYNFVKEELDKQWRDLATADKTKVSLTPEDKLAVLDCAYLLQQILSGTAKVNRHQDLVPQFIQVLTGKAYKARAFPAVDVSSPVSPIAVASVSVIAGSPSGSPFVSVASPLSPSSPASPSVEVAELLRMVQAQEAKQKALEQQLRQQSEESSRREREREREIAELKRKMEEMGMASGGGSQAQALALPFAAGSAASATPVSMLYQHDERLKRLESARAVEEEAGRNVAFGGEKEDESARQQLFGS